MANLLLPDPVIDPSLTSLARVRQAIFLREKGDWESCLERLLAETPHLAQIATLARDPLDGCLFVFAARGNIILYVRNQNSLFFEINYRAFHSTTALIQLLATIEDGKFAVIRSRTGHDSLEAALDGNPIYVSRDAAFEQTRVPPPSERMLAEALKKLIDEYKRSDAVPTNHEIVARVKQSAGMQRASDSRIRAALKILKPRAWSRPGRRKK